MVATGLPPHTVLALRVDSLGEDIRDLKRKIAIDSEDHSKRLEKMQSELPDIIVELILQKVNIDGARQVTHEDLERLRNSIVQEFRRAIDDVAPQHGDAPPPQVAGGDIVPLYQQVADGGEPDPDRPAKWERWSWNMRIHPVPKGWQFPFKNLLPKHLWDLWYFGIPAQRIRPFRFLHTFDVAEGGAKYLSRAKTVMNTLEMFLRIQKLIPDGEPLENNLRVARVIENAATVEGNDLYDANHNTPDLLSDHLFLVSFELLMTVIDGANPRKRQYGNLKLPTIYNDIHKHEHTILFDDMMDIEDA
jgi:hypothetical protein